MITQLFDPSQMLALGQALLQDDGSMVVWSQADAAVSVLFALMHEGVSDKDQLIEAACKVPQVEELVAWRMMRIMCGDDPSRSLWRHNGFNRLTLWSRG
ncbi:hypothetical protein [Sphingobium cupriresistens]|uniref:Uncharacterized protein n=1 Tax=Sphingobium cupriresistens LL01 TaxID=1420583 RepID=A0A0J7XWH4_9SPHN|nr:hypothetical protein [Sphingobium cupriresistens]KMS55939.1 hypothetical protein V473_13620 [Sphingobium cupriresistens LL01]